MTRTCFALVLTLMGCTHSDEKAIEQEVRGLSKEDALSLGLVDRVVRFGVKAIPELEMALHTDVVTTRLNVTLALRRVGLVEAVPLLRHLASHDADERVRFEAEHALKAWAELGDARGDAARRALRRVSEVRRESESG